MRYQGSGPLSIYDNQPTGSKFDFQPNRPSRGPQRNYFSNVRDIIKKNRPWEEEEKKRQAVWDFPVNTSGYWGGGYINNVPGPDFGKEVPYTPAPDPRFSGMQGSPMPSRFRDAYSALGYNRFSPMDQYQSRPVGFDLDQWLTGGVPGGSGEEEEKKAMLYRGWNELSGLFGEGKKYSGYTPKETKRQDNIDWGLLFGGMAESGGFRKGDYTPPYMSGWDEGYEARLELMGGGYGF